MPDYTMPERGHAALLTINAQRDFIQPGSPLRACGVDAVLPNMGRLADAFRASGAPIFHALRLYRPDGSNVDNFRRQAVEEGMRVLMPGTSGVELIDEVNPARGNRLDSHRLLAGDMQSLGRDEWAFYKSRWGAFHGTPLEQQLRNMGITTLVLCGCNFSTSGRATVFEAGARDFRVVMVPDAMAGVTDEAARDMGRIGVYLMTTEACLTWLNGSQGASAAA